jgi:hypothetical protein
MKEAAVKVPVETGRMRLGFFDFTCVGINSTEPAMIMATLSKSRSTDFVTVMGSTTAALTLVGDPPPCANKLEINNIKNDVNRVPLFIAFYKKKETL